MHTDKQELVNSMAAGPAASAVAGKKALPGGMAAGLHPQADCAAHSAVHRYQQAADTGLIFLPAAGYRNGTDVNDQGSNGNYWSSSLNEDNPNNAWNLNFNSSNANVNNNNRYNGYTVRAVQSN